MTFSDFNLEIITHRAKGFKRSCADKNSGGNRNSK